MSDPINLSDPKGLAAGDFYSSESSAAYAAIKEINPISIALGREFGGSIYPQGSGFTYSSPTMLGAAGGSIMMPANVSAIFHTHGSNDPGYDNNNFSSTDISTATGSMMNSYLGTPGAPMQVYNPFSGSGQCYR